VPIPFLGETRRLRLYNRLRHRAPFLVEQPHEAFVSILCVFAGVPLIFNAVQAQSLEAILPRPLVISWGIALVIGSLLTLYGLIRAERYMPDMSRALKYRRIEYVGFVIMTYASFIYTVGIVSSTIWDKVAPGAAIVTAFALTCAVRAFVIRSQIEVYLTGLGIRDER
jgi:hypothetical protein